MSIDKVKILDYIQYEWERICTKELPTYGSDTHKSACQAKLGMLATLKSKVLAGEFDIDKHPTK